MAASSRRADLEATLASGGDRVPGRRPGGGDGRRQRHRARAPAAHGGPRRTGRACSTSSRTPAPSSSGLVAGQHGRLHRGAEPRPADEPDGALRLGAARRRLPQAHARGAGDTRRPARARARSSSRWPRPRDCRPTPTRCGAGSTRSTSETGGRASLVSAVPPVRPDLQLTEGYHSPQVEAEVRLNTNESPFAPPEAWREELLAALAEVSFHRYPDRPATELRQAVADLHGVTPDEVFCANGSNEVLQSLLLAFGGPGRRALVFEPTYALHSHIARITGTEVVEGARDDDFLIDPVHALELLASAATRRHLPLLAQQPDRPGRATRDRGRPSAAAAPGLVIVDEAYGQFSPWSALALRGPGQRGSRGDPHLLQDVGHGRGAPRLPGGGSGGGGRLRVRGAALPPVGADAGRRPHGAAPRARDGGAGWPASPRSGGEWPPHWPTCRWTAGPPTPTSSCSGPGTATPPRSGSALLDHSILIRNCASWDGLRGCLRVTIGTADENDRFLHALKETL